MSCVLFLLLIGVAAATPAAWCAAQKMAPVPHPACDVRGLLTDSMEILSWMTQSPMRSLLACRASGETTVRWVTACLFQTHADATAFDKAVRDMAPGMGLWMEKTRATRDACNPHPELGCFHGNSDPIIEIHVRLPD